MLVLALERNRMNSFHYRLLMFDVGTFIISPMHTHTFTVLHFFAVLPVSPSAIPIKVALLLLYANVTLCLPIGLFTSLTSLIALQNMVRFAIIATHCSVLPCV